MHKKKDLSGYKINNLEIISEVSAPYKGVDKKRKTILKLECKCICGEIFFPYKINVVRGRTKQCARCSQSHKMLNKKFGSLLVLERDFSEVYTSFKCKCDCGSISVIRDRHLKSGKDKRCKDCISSEIQKVKEQDKLEVNKKKQKKIIDKDEYIQSFINKKSGRLTVSSFLKLIKRKVGSRIVFSCYCECGNETTLRSDQIGIIKSCGCLQQEMLKLTQSGENNKRSKLTNVQVKEIRELFSSGLFTLTELSKTFNVHLGVISGVVKNKTYKIV